MRGHSGTLVTQKIEARANAGASIGVQLGKGEIL